MHDARRWPATRAVAAACLTTALAAGCVSHLPEMPANAIVAPSAALPAPPVERSDAPPKIVAMRFSTLDVHRGSQWHGEFVTGTNVASVEVRTNLFSIDVPRTAFGRFAFDVNVYDAPPIFVRPYRLRVIARNTAGDEGEEDLPFQIR